MRVLGLVPARSGSQRVPGKNVRELRGFPLLAYAVSVALASKVFSNVVCSTDSEEYAGIARRFGAEVPVLRPLEFASADSPDIEWVRHSLDVQSSLGREYDAFAILRPTSPFRKPSHIRHAWQLFSSSTGIDSLRAVEECSQHPGKMWLRGSQLIHPLLPFSIEGVPWHSNQKAKLPVVYVQNAFLEISLVSSVRNLSSISGERVLPYLIGGPEAMDLNNENDWELAELYLSTGRVTLDTPIEASARPL